MKTILLLGAGAAIPWGGKLSSELTDLLIANKDFMVNESDSLAGYIHSQLITYYKTNESVNFETIVDAIEALTYYYLNNSSEGARPISINHTPIWFDESIIAKAIFSVNYLKFISQNRSRYAPGREKVFYLIEDLKQYMRIIVDCVVRYEDNIEDVKYSSVNNSLNNLYNFLNTKFSPVRTYTTNYDNLIPEILTKRSIISFYNGFCNSKDKYSEFPLIPNLHAITFEENQLCYYNLHGSIYWNYDLESFRYKFLLTPSNWHYPVEWTLTANTSIGHEIIVTNIITGYSKLDRIQLEPVYSIFQAFNRDCQASEKILIIVGFSFGDTHLNKIIQDSMSDDTYLLIITMGDENFLDTSTGRLLSNLLRVKGEFHKAPEITNEWIISGNKKQFIYLKGFKDFLEGEKWLEFIDLANPNS